MSTRDAPFGGFARPADLAACREMIRTGSRSFYLASLLLPDEVRGAAYALYGFCRLSDDAVDLEGGRADALARLRSRLARIYEGAPGPEPVDRALADSVHAFGIPVTAMEALLEGLEWDVSGRVYETLSDVRAYAARVAGSVGVMMAALMGARSPHLVARACDLGVAMQLTNIARDVGEDARIGRLYLPRAWMREAGLDPDAWLAAPAFGAEIAHVVSRLLEAADDLYARADAGIACLAPEFRPAIFAAGRLYAEIGARVRARGFDSVNSRATVPAWRKAQLVALAWARAQRPPALRDDAPALPETRFLVDGAALAPFPTFKRRGRRRLDDDVAWTIDLFASLERRAGAP